MPDWLNWLGAVTGVLGFLFSIVAFLLESKTRRRLTAAGGELHEARRSFERHDAALKETQKELELAEKALDERLSHLEKLSAYAAGATRVKVG
ncbi:MAG: hypothetical protein WBX25_08150 [Rhodomicrobium sp.]